MKLDERFVERLYSIPWFSKCGNPFVYDGVVSVPSTKEVIKSINARMDSTHKEHFRNMVGNRMMQ